MALHVALEREHVRLEPLEPRHEEELWSVAQDPRTWRWMKVRGHESREAFHAWFEGIETGFAHYFDGDLLSPSLLSGTDKGANTIEFTNIVPFDIAVPGNHEFDFGPDNFLERMKQSVTDVVRELVGEAEP